MPNPLRRFTQATADFVVFVLSANYLSLTQLLPAFLNFLPKGNACKKGGRNVGVGVPAFFSFRGGQYEVFLPTARYTAATVPIFIGMES
jgi:hypothetical protein